MDIYVHNHKISWQVLESWGPGKQPSLTEEMKMAGAASLSSQWWGVHWGATVLSMKLYSQTTAEALKAYRPGGDGPNTALAMAAVRAELSS